MKLRQRLGRIIWGQGFMDDRAITQERGVARILVRGAFGFFVILYTVQAVSTYYFVSGKLPWSYSANGLWPIWAQLLFMPAWYFMMSLIVAGMLWRERVKRFKASGAAQPPETTDLKT
jgi:hypothetical protein